MATKKILTDEEFNQLGVVGEFLTDEEFAKLNIVPLEEYESEIPEISLASFSERARIGFGNTTGIKKFLKSKGYEDVVEREGRLFVKVAGQLYPVDPNRLEIGDIADLAGSLPGYLGYLKGSAIGALAGPGGSIAGAGIGSAVGEVGRQALGKTLGVQAPQDLGGRAVDVAVAGIAGSVAQGLVLTAQGLVNVLKPYVQRIPGNQYNKLLNPPKEELIKNYRLKEKTIGDKLAERGVFALNRDQFYNKMLDSINDSEKKVQDIISQNSTLKVSTSRVLSYLEDVKDGLINNVGTSRDLSIVDSVAKDLKGFGAEIPIDVANKIKRNIYKDIISKQWLKANEQLPTLVLAKKKLAEGLKVGIEEALPGNWGSNLKNINIDYGTFIEAARLIAQGFPKDVMAKLWTQGNLWTISLSTVLGALWTGTAGGAGLTGAGLLAGKNLMQTTMARTGLAQVERLGLIALKQTEPLLEEPAKFLLYHWVNNLKRGITERP